MAAAPLMRRICAATLIASLLAVVPAQHALAHAIPVESNPSDGAVLTAAPKVVELRLSERVLARFSTAQLLDGSGHVMAGIEIPITQPEPNLLVFTLPKLSDGAYTLFWTAFSKDDGHFSKGLLLFGVGSSANLASAARPEIDRWPAPFEVAVRWLNLGLLVMLVGAIGITGLVLDGRPGLTSVPGLLLQTARTRVCAWSVGCACSAFVVGAAVLLAEAAALVATQPAEASLWQPAWQIVHETRWGALWLIRQALLLAVIGVVLLLYRRARTATTTGRSAQRHWRDKPWLAAATLSLGLVTIQALTGHAASVGDQVGLAVAADALHLLAASLWVGGIFALAYGLLPLMRTGSAEFTTLAREGWGAFSRLAALAVAVLFATGFYAVGRQVASLDALITAFYGLSILAKVALVLAMGAIGLLNAALLHPGRMPATIVRLAGRVRRRVPIVLAHLPRLIRADMSLALLVLALTAAITASPPPLGAEFNIAPENVRQQQSRVIDDLTVTLLAKPGRPGQNLLTVFAASSRRPAPAEIIRVILRFTFQGRDLGRISSTAEAVEPGRYIVAGRQLSVAGQWRIDVVIRRRGIPDTIVPFEWIVPPTAALSPTILSKQPIRPAARNLSMAVLLLAIGAIVIRVRKDRIARRGTASAERGAGTADSASASSPAVASTISAQ